MKNGNCLKVALALARQKIPVFPYERPAQVPEGAGDRALEHRWSLNRSKDDLSVVRQRLRSPGGFSNRQDSLGSTFSILIGETAATLGKRSTGWSCRRRKPTPRCKVASIAC